MRAAAIFLLCCFCLFCVIGPSQKYVCGVSDPTKQSNKCSNTLGTIGCLICCGSIFLILMKR